jgi:GWxTD domain-containing protein
MRIRPTAVAIVPVLFLSWSGLAVAAKLDKDDKEWLDEVRPLMLADEEKTYRDLEDKADREEFRKIFWARRDPDITTPENEYQPEYEAAREKADEEYRVTGRVGSLTDCGRVFILLGEPDDSEVRAGTVSVLTRVPEVWIYKDKPGRTFEGGEARIAFDAECRAPSGIQDVLDQIAAARIAQPQLEYRRGEDGRLVTLEDQLPKDSPARALLNAPRQDFPMAFDTSYMRTAEEDMTGVVGLIRGEVPDLPVTEKDGKKIANIVVATSVVDGNGTETMWTEQPVRAEVQPDGSFLASYGISVAPGQYTLNVATVVGEGPLGSHASAPIEVPDFSRVETAEDGSEQKLPSAASILFIREVEDLPADAEADPGHAYAAFRLGQAQLIPHFGRELLQSDTVSFFYFIYDLPTDPVSGAADASVAFSILQGGKPKAQAPVNPATTAVVGSAVGPVPLAGFKPGSYVAQIRVTDKLEKKSVIKNEKFTVVAAEGSAP